jgi:hypothetical protein
MWTTFLDSTLYALAGLGAAWLMIQGIKLTGNLIVKWERWIVRR